MKKITFSLLFLLICTQASAATYYVRTDGGTISQCDGKTDHALAEASGSNCAVSGMVEIIRHTTDGGSTFAGTTVVVGGDTVIFGDPGGTPGQFRFGYDSGNIWSGCDATNSRGCYIDTIPAGSDSSHQTKIVGRGYDTGCTGTKAQLWGGEEERRILEVHGNVDVECLEITDHSSCMYDGAQDGTVDGFPTQCHNHNDYSSNYGPWGQDGIWFSGSGGTFKNLDIHGMALYGMYSVGDFGDNTFDHVLVHTASYANITTGPADVGSGTMTFLVPNIKFGGCGERYPLQSSDLRSTSNLHHCMSQGQNGSGGADGIAFGNAGSGNAGNWVIYGGEISFNAGDGLDILHATGNGTITISRLLAEGNNGQAIKLNAITNYVENSKLIGNCGWFHGQTFTSTKDSSGASVSFSDCRAGGNTATIQMGSNVKAYLYNNTVLCGGDVCIETSGSGCDGGTLLDFRNNIVYGGWQFSDDAGFIGGGGDDLSAFYFASGSDTCSSQGITEDYNVVYQTKNSNANCTGIHSVCGSDPLFLGTIKQGHGTVASYYQGTDYGAQINIQTGSPAKNVGINSLTYQNGSSDFNSFTRTVNFDMGALEFGSTSGATPRPATTGQVLISGGKVQ